MKEVFYIDDTPGNKISYYFMLVFLVTLPFDRLFSELALIGLLLHTIIHFRSDRGMTKVRRQGGLPDDVRRRLPVFRSGWLTAALYLLTMVGTLWSARRGEAFKELEKQLALLFVPLIFYFTEMDWKKVQRPLLKAFALSCLFTTLYLYGIAFGRIRQQGLPLSSFFSPPFMNHQFSAPIGLHATYFSMYIAISLVTFIWLMLRARRTLDRWFYALGSLILLAAILQLAARSVCISLLFVINGLLPYWLMKGRTRRIFLGVSLFLTAVVFVALTSNENLHTRYLVQLQQDLKGNVGDKDGSEPRMVRWFCAWELIRAAPWTGYGSGTEVDLLKEKYAVHQLYDSYAHDLNAHNQYLSILLKTGILGEILFLGVLAIGLRQAWRLKDPFLGSFLVIVICVSFSENILDVNKGIFFFSFFFSLFLAKPGGAQPEVPGCEEKPIFVSHYGNKNTLPLVGT